MRNNNTILVQNLINVELNKTRVEKKKLKRRVFFCDTVQGLTVTLFRCLKINLQFDKGIIDIANNLKSFNILWLPYRLKFQSWLIIKILSDTFF